MDLISREELIADLLEARREETDTIPKLIRFIEQRPTAEPKRGRWIIGNKTSVFDLEGVKTWAVRLTCSECLFSLNFVEGHTAQYRFCPQCGAKMENNDE